MTMRVGVLISGRGSNMSALIKAAAAPGYPAKIVLALSDNADAAGLAAAQAAGVEARAIPRADFPNRAAHESALDAALRAAQVQTVCLAGYMRVLSADFLAGWRDRVLNIHPSLLPSYRGLDTHARALADGVRLHGCSVHIVRPALDDGPILGQAGVPVLAGDTETSLSARVLRQEHRLYPVCLSLFASGAIRIEGDRAILPKLGDPEAALSQP